MSVWTTRFSIFLRQQHRKENKGTTYEIQHILLTLLIAVSFVSAQYITQAFHTRVSTPGYLSS
jgi:hypothetical protein